MATSRNIEIVREAAKINGHVPLYGERGTYEVRDILAVRPNGAWITNCLASGLSNRIEIPRVGQARFVARAKEIIAAKDQILAERAPRLAAAREA